MLCHLILHSLISSHLHSSSSKGSFIIKNIIILLVLCNISSNSFVGFILHLFSISDSVISHSINIFIWIIPSDSTFKSSYFLFPVLSQYYYYYYLNYFLGYLSGYLLYYHLFDFFISFKFSFSI